MMYWGRAKNVLGKAKVGDRLRVKKGARTYEGTLMPRTEAGDDRHLVLKLDSGYNVGIDIESIEIKVLPAREKAAHAKLPKRKKGEKLPRVSILGTGGTIASKIDYRTGAVHPSLSTEELLNAVPELGQIADIDTKVLFNILSENMTPKHWVKIAKAVARELNSGAHGVVVAHGTDTLGYTASALAFMLKELKKPVVLVGSQRSSDRPSSDSSLNLVSAVRVAVSDLGEVVAVMHGSTEDSYCLIHRGTRVRKMHSSRRDAFKSVNALPIGEVEGTEVRLFQDHVKRGEGEVKVDAKLEENVALVKVYPGFKPENLDYFVDNCKGIVLEGTGLGHARESLFGPLERAQEKGVPVVMATQTLFGRVDMKVYSTGRELMRRGVISAMDMLPEVAYIKLMYVLGKTTKPADVEMLMHTNLAGEISPGTRIELV